MPIAWGMNIPSSKTITLTFHGQLTLSREALAGILREAQIQMNGCNEYCPIVQSSANELPRLEISIRETAKISNPLSEAEREQNQKKWLEELKKIMKR
jgi:hypothetical protein